MLLLFDFDGTLCDSIDEAIEAANGVLKHTNKKMLSKAEIRNTGFREVIRKRKINKLQLLFAVLYYRRRLASMIDTLDTFPDLPQVIQKLAKKHTLGIITSNSRDNVVSFLKHHSLDNCFSIIESEFSYFGKHTKILKISKDKLVHKKDILYIGDETRDVSAARKAGVKAISVTWGFESKAVLKKAKPDKIIESPTKLLLYY